MQPLSDDEKKARREGWGIFRYVPTRPTTEKPYVNDQLSFHQSLAKIRVVTGPNRAGKTTPGVAECAAAILGEDHPDWWGRRIMPPKKPLTIWLSSPVLPTHPLADARVKRMFVGYKFRDPVTGEQSFMPPLIPPSFLKNPKALENSESRVFETKDGDIVVLKSSKQSALSAAGEEPDVIFVDEPTETPIWSEYVARVAQNPTSFIIHVLTDATEHNQTDYIDWLRRDQDGLVEFFRFSHENPHIDTGHHGQVMNLLPPEQRRVRRGGETLTEVRRCYPFANHWHEDDDPKKPEILNQWGGHGNWIPRSKIFPIPAHWTFYLVYDPGITNPGAGHMIAVEPGVENLYVCRGVHFEEPSVDLMVDVRSLFEMAGTTRIRTAFIDPKATKHPMQFVGHAPKERLKIDLYNKAASNVLRRPFKFAQAPSSVEMMKRETRIAYLNAYLSRHRTTAPMMWFFDDGTEGMEALKREFDKYHWGASPKGRTNNPTRPVPKHDHHIYCCEVPAIMGFHWFAPDGEESVLVPHRGDPLDPGGGLRRFMEGGYAEGFNRSDFT